MSPKAPLILVVDDEVDILTLLEYNLERSGFRVIKAKDGP
ncbi:MAG TPA: DNA-binding response regulator, partial [Deltaproteobacteria bacterium]|nr:DNA-binding response regulator [Deltaproteobacteria bacterium]